MNKKRKKRNPFVFPLLAAAMLLSVGASAQRGLFDRGQTDEAYYGYGGDGHAGLFGLRSSETSIAVSNQPFGTPLGGDNINNQPFGGHYITPDAITNESFVSPIGSGTLVLLAAGAGYATIKTRKRNKKNK